MNTQRKKLIIILFLFIPSLAIAKIGSGKVTLHTFPSASILPTSLHTPKPSITVHCSPSINPKLYDKLYPRTNLSPSPIIDHEDL